MIHARPGILKILFILSDFLFVVAHKRKGQGSTNNGHIARAERFA